MFRIRLGGDWTLPNVMVVLATLALIASAGGAGSVLALPWFLVLVAAFVWLPGTVALDLGRIHVRVLEDLALALVLGVAATTGVYWLAASLGVRDLFPLWPIACAFWAGVHWRRQALRLAGLRAAVRSAATFAPLVLVAASLVPYTFLPLFFSNLKASADGSLTFYPLPDLVLHASLAQEVTHTIPPAWPFLPGYSVSYHYAMDLLPAIFGVGGVAPADACVRFVPVLLTTMTVLSLCAWGRDWLGSTGAGALAALLAVAGEDFSWIPGVLLGQGSVPWAAAYFGMPTTASLYMLNPMLPALGTLAAALLCLRHWLAGKGGGFLFLGALLVVAIAQYKVFTAAHLLASLLLAGAVAWLRDRDHRLLVACGLCAVLLLPSVFLRLGDAAKTRVEVLLQPWPYVPGFLVRVGLWGASWLGPLRATHAGYGNAIGILQFAVVGVIGFLVGSLGMRVLALPALWRARREEPIRVALAIFVILGPLLTLTFSVVVPGLPPSQQYNNAVWFYVQAKYLAWVFVVETLRRLSAALTPRGRSLLWAGALLAALGSGVQYFGYQLAVRQQATLSPNLMAVVRALEVRARPGEVVWAREHVSQPLVSLTRCHVLSLGVFPYLVLDAEGISGIQSRQEAFWRRWRSRELDEAPLHDWKARYVVADVTLDGEGPRSAASGRLLPLLENAEFALYEVKAP